MTTSHPDNQCPKCGKWYMSRRQASAHYEKVHSAKCATTLCERDLGHLGQHHNTYLGRYWYE